MTPGLIDSHTHPILAALAEKNVPLPVIHSIVGLQAYIRQQTKTQPSGRVIIVPKVFSTRLEERRYPTRYEIDEASGGRAAMTDNGYSAVLNSTSLTRLAITRAIPEPPDGKIVKYSSGEPTGLILGARKLLTPLLSEAPCGFEDRIRALNVMQGYYNRAGLTSVIDRSEDAEGFRAYQALWRRGGLTVRTCVTWVVSLQGSRRQVRERIEAIPMVTGWGDDWIRVGALKTFLDGGILTGTAYLRNPYGDNTAIYGYKDSDYCGVLSAPRENIVEMARVANRLGWQMTAHVTGGGSGRDAATRPNKEACHLTGNVFIASSHSSETSVSARSR